MSEQEFLFQLARLKKAFSDNAYPEERAKLFWRALKPIDPAKMQTAVDSLIANNRSAPMLKDILTELEGPVSGKDSGLKTKWVVGLSESGVPVISTNKDALLGHPAWIKPTEYLGEAND